MATPEKIYSLGAGKPGLSIRLAAIKVLQQATEHRLKEELETGAEFLTYLPTGEGHPKFREALARFLSEEYGDPVSSESLHLTAGATHGLHLALTLLLEKSSPIFAEEPLYYFAAGVIKDCDMKGVPVQMDNEGLCPNDLEDKVKEYKDTWEKTSSDKLYRGAVYMVPTFHNPTGMCYSPERCRALIAVARKYNLLLISEDVYNLLYYSGSAPPKRLFYYDKKSDPDYVGSVLSNASFSKYLAPGVRVGWYEGPDKIIEKTRNSTICVSGGPVNHLGSGFVTSAINLGIQQDFLRKIRAIYAKRASTFIRVLREHLPKSCSFDAPEGGYFLWVRLPAGVDNSEIAMKANTEYGVRITDGRRFSQAGAFKNCIRLSISAIEDEDIEDGLRALCDCLHKYLPQ